MKRNRKISENQRKQYRIITVALCIAILLFCACSAQTKDKKTQDKDLPQIVIGCDNYTPFNYIGTDGQPTGIDVDLAEEAFGRMGYRVRFKFINWENKKELLEAGEIDCIWCCYSMDGREDEYQWAGPYMQSFQVVAVNQESPIKTLQDLGGKRVAVQSTTKPEEILLHTEEYHLPKLKALFCMQNRELIYSFLSKGYADAIAAHETSILQYMSDYEVEDQYRILDEPLLSVGLGAAFCLDDTRELAPKLNQTMREMYEDGTSERILSNYLKTPQKYLEVYEDER